jgi:hypothetical protein
MPGVEAEPVRRRPEAPLLAQVLSYPNIIGTSFLVSIRKFIIYNPLLDKNL